MATGRSVQVIDRRGRGASGDATSYAPDREVDDVLAVLAALGPKADLLGHSSGAILALQAAERAPMELRRLVLYEPPLFFEDDDAIPADLPERLEALLADGDEDRALETFLREGPRAQGSDIQEMRSHEAAWPWMLALVHTIPYDARIVRDFDMDLRRLGDMRTPTLMLIGSDSPPRVRRASETVAQALPDVRIEELPGQKTPGAAPRTRGLRPRRRPVPDRRLKPSTGAARPRVRPATLPDVELHAAGTRWAIATPHTVATEAGAVAFERGGNALDAALVAAVTLAVSYPHNCGVGGDLFALVQRPDGSTVAINASGRAPAGVDAQGLRERHGVAMPEEGPDSITVPGAVSGWAALHAEGATLPWAEAFGPAIALAHGGVAVSRSLSRALTERRTLLAADPGMVDVFFRDGAPLPRGALFRQPALGATLQELASGGPPTLYGGSLGERYAAGLRATGAPFTVDDMAAHRADVVPPLSGRYRDLDVRVVPPNSQGFTLLEMLALAERMGIDPDPLGPDAGTLALVFAAANRDRDRSSGRPRRDARAPVHAARRRAPRRPGGPHPRRCSDDGGARPSSRVGRHDRLGGGRCRRLGGLADPEPVGQLRRRDPGARDRDRGPRPRRLFHAGARSCERDRARETAVPHPDAGAGAPQRPAGGGRRLHGRGLAAPDQRAEPDPGVRPRDGRRRDDSAAPRWTVWGDRGDGVVRAEGSVPDATTSRFAEAGFRIDRLDDVDEAVGHAHIIPCPAGRNPGGGQRPEGGWRRAGALTAEPPNSRGTWPITPRCRTPAENSAGCEASSPIWTGSSGRRTLGPCCSRS